MTFLEIAVRAGLWLVFVFAVVGKVRNGAAFRAFTGSLASVPLLPARLRTAAGVAVVGAEALTAVLLAVPATVRIGYAAAAVVLLAFATTVSAGLVRGDPVRCHCFGVDAGRAGPGELARDAALLLAALVGLAASAHQAPLSAATTGSTAALAALAAAVGTLGAVAAGYGPDLYQLIHQLTAGPAGGRPAAHPGDGPSAHVRARQDATAPDGSSAHVHARKNGAAADRSAAHVRAKQGGAAAGGSVGHVHGRHG
jgi:hypothetical protein